MIFRVSAQDYFGRGTSDPNCFSGARFVEMVERPIRQLIARYSLSGRSVLSIGAGTAFEEYWFHQAGCQLTLTDLDVADKHLTEYLLALPHVEGSDAITFRIEDAAKSVREGGRFDVLYVSSFPPDELRREKIVASHGRWPDREEPYLPLLIDALRCVGPNGLCIFQSYRGGVDPSLNPHYIPLIQSADFAEVDRAVRA